VVELVAHSLEMAEMPWSAATMMLVSRARPSSARAARMAASEVGPSMPRISACRLVALVALGCRRDRATSQQQALVARREQRQNRGRGGGNEIVRRATFAAVVPGVVAVPAIPLAPRPGVAGLLAAYGQGPRLPPR
jgi:hypothetical protein